MIEDLLDLILPNYKRPGWKQAKWTIIPLLLTVAIPGFAILSLLLSIGPDNPFESITTPAIALFASVFVFPLTTRLIFWQLFVRRLAQNSNRPQKPRQPQDGETIPAHQLSPSGLENEIAWIFETLNPSHRAEITGGIGDEGIDIKVYDKTGMLKGIVQVKRLQPGAFCKPTHLRNLDSCRRRLGVANALLATTGTFSTKTRDQAKAWNISLWDGEKLGEYRQRAYQKIKEGGRRAVPASPMRDGHGALEETRREDRKVAVPQHERRSQKPAPDPEQNPESAHPTP